MSIEYRWGREEDYKRIIELANHAFAENDHTQDFEKNTSETSFFPFILPKLYQNIETAPMHYLAVKDGEFVGNVGLFEQPMMVSGELLHVGGIGTVCVRPGHRREGFMKQLMNDVIEKARADKKDYLILGGQRQRYENWGFGCAGMNSVFTFDYGNFRRLFSEDADFGYSFQKLGKEDREYLAMERKLRTADGIYQVRSEELEFAALFSMGFEPYVILKEGAFQGSFLMNRKPSEVEEIWDLRLVDETQVIEILNDLNRFLKDRIQIRITGIAPNHQEMLTRLYRACEEFTTGWREMMLILNYERTLRAFLSYKASYTELIDGELTASFPHGEVLKIRVKNGVPSVEKTAETEGAVSFTDTEAVNVFFGAGNHIADMKPGIPKEVKIWFPLPFYLSMSDET